MAREHQTFFKYLEFFFSPDMFAAAFGFFVAKRLVSHGARGAGHKMEEKNTTRRDEEATRWVDQHTVVIWQRSSSVPSGDSCYPAVVISHVDFR